jgi:hypothetical protein
VNISRSGSSDTAKKSCELWRSYNLKENREILPFVITLEHATLRQVREALDSIRNRDYIVVDPVWFPIWGTK